MNLVGFTLVFFDSILHEQDQSTKVNWIQRALTQWIETSNHLDFMRELLNLGSIIAMPITNQTKLFIFLFPFLWVMFLTNKCKPTQQNFNSKNKNAPQIKVIHWGKKHFNKFFNSSLDDRKANFLPSACAMSFVVVGRSHVFGGFEILSKTIRRKEKEMYEEILDDN